jgi:hypothetical protein
MNAELAETNQLMQCLGLMIDNYRRISFATGDDAAVSGAARRVKEALRECLKKAEAELTPAANPGSFDCHFCGAAHDLARDLKVLETEGFHTVFLQRRFRYDYRHAIEVVRQLDLRGLVPADDVAGAMEVATR